MRILVTGASGFIGSSLVAELVSRQHAAVAAVRNNDARQGLRSIERVITEEIGADSVWEGRLAGIDAVVHLAARAHVRQDGSMDPLVEYRSVNVAGTENLARAAASAGVRRFVYVSSIGVNGDKTAGAPFTEQDVPSPQSAYALSKWEAEQVLARVAAETGMEVVVVRPPLVYGPDAPGNFAQLMRALQRGVPLPLSSVHNQRSFIYIGNLVDALVACVVHPAAAGQTYLLCDGEDISTPELLRELGAALGRPARLFACPTWLLELAGRLSGRSIQIARLLDSLQVDNARIRRELGWSPPYSLRQGLKLTAECYRS